MARPDYADGHLAGLRRFARDLTGGAPVALDDAVEEPACLLVRRAALAGLPGAGGLLAALRSHGEVVAVPTAYVHRCAERTGADWVAARGAGTRTAAPRRRTGDVLVSACMIVKDEQDELPGCLASLVGVADEVVVYDTGSSDATVELARRAGATVIEGYWDDDFARARNAALAECRGAWVLHVDADERVVGDAGALRAELVAGEGYDALAPDILNLDDDGSVGGRHRAARLFRRGRGRWTGRLHEQLVALPGQPELEARATTAIAIEHRGYAESALEQRGKRERNVRLAQAALREAGTAERAARLLDLGRAQFAARRFDEALACFEEARVAEATPIVRRAVLWKGAELLLVLGRPGEALEWAAALRAASTRGDVAAFLEGVAHLMLGEPASALAALDSVEELWMEDGNYSLSADLVDQHRAVALAAAERWPEATAAFAELLARRPQLALWGPFLDACWRSTGDMAAVAAVLPEAELSTVLAQVVLADRDAADALGESLWSGHPGDPRVVAFGAHLGARLELARALAWSSRVRAAGLAERCPLLARAGRYDVAPSDAVLAAAVASSAFGDPAAEALVARLAPRVPVPQLRQVLVDVGEVAPALLPALVTAAASTPPRCLALADALEALGAGEQAGVLRARAATVAA